MRDSTRIPRIISQLERCWLKAPDLRLGQLFENLKSWAGKDDLFWMEDDEFELLIQDFYNHFLKD